jgi:C-terminal processing protease CtpA/Prc
MEVKPGSPGAEAGLERGDFIVQVDERPCADLSLDEMRQFFRIDGRRILTVEKGGKKRKVTFELKR